MSDAPEGGQLRKAPRVKPDKAGAPSSGKHGRPERMLMWFQFDHLPEGKMRDTSAQFACLAESVVFNIAPGPERTVALRKLVEAKDCAVRAVIEERAAEAAAQAEAQGGE